MELTKDELIKLYHGELWSLTDIAKRFDCNIATIHRQFKKHGIPTRDPRTATKIYLDKTYDKPLSNELIEFIEGNLLGDGALRKSKKNSNAHYTHGDKHCDYIEWIADYFRKENIKVNIYRQRENYWFMQTEVNVYLSEIYEKWYPENHTVKLKLPVDFTITPIKLRQWYIGDGSKKSNNSVSISKDSRLDLSDKLRLQQEIENALNIKTTWHKDADNLMSRLYITTSYSAAFFDYIGECPIDSYRYKWPFQLH